MGLAVAGGREGRKGMGQELAASLSLSLSLQAGEN